jgi:hypothetical protein
MNSLPRINSEPENLAQADAVLHRYFTAEVPTHWPPAPAVKPMPRRQFALRRSHLALAASFLAAVGCWWCCGLGSGSSPELRPGVREGLPPTGKPPRDVRPPVSTAKHRPGTVQ